MAKSKRTQDRIDFAKDMIEVLKERLKASAGIQSVTSDGVSTTFATGGAESVRAQLEYWEKELTRLTRSGGATRTIDLSGGL
jgi:hypothetical protein